MPGGLGTFSGEAPGKSRVGGKRASWGCAIAVSGSHVIEKVLVLGFLFGFSNFGAF